MKKTTYTTTRFDVGYDGFYVEVSPHYHGEEKWLEFVLCQENYGMKRFMFYLPQGEEDQWEDCIQAVLDEEIKEYEEFLNHIEMTDIFYHEHNKIN